MHYVLFNFIDESEAVCCWRAGVCHLLCSRAVLTCVYTAFNTVHLIWRLILGIIGISQVGMLGWLKVSSTEKTAAQNGVHRKPACRVN